MASNITHCAAHRLSQASSLALGVLNSLSGFVTVVGNTLVLFAIIRNSSLRSTSHLFIASLASADLIVGAVVNPLYASLSLELSLQDVWQMKNAESFVWLLTVVATTFNMCAVAIDRFIAVTTPFRYYVVVTVPRCAGVIFLTWIFAFLFSSASFLIAKTNLKVLWIIGTFLTVVGPFFILSYCYFHIYKVARIHSNRIQAADQTTSFNTTSQEEVRVRMKNKKAAVTFAIVTVLFMVFYIPTVVTKLMALGATTQCQFQALNLKWFWAALISYCSSAVNPWVYAIRMREFRETFRKMLTCRK